MIAEKHLVLQFLREKAERPGRLSDNKRWRPVFLDTARPQGISREDFDSCLGELEQDGLFLPRDSAFWGEVRFDLDDGARVGRPHILSLAATSRCNLRCVMCDHGVRHVEKEDFDETLFDNIGDFVDTAGMFDLTGLGEPMLSALFWKVIDRSPVETASKDDDFVITFNTNGTLLTDANIDRILSARVSKIRVSIDAPDEETFFKIRGTKLQPILNGLRLLIQKRNALGRRRPRVGVEMTIMRETIGKAAAMIYLCKDLGADFIEIWSLNALPQHVSEGWRVDKNGWSFSYSDQFLTASARLNATVESWYAIAEFQGVALATFMNGTHKSTSNFHEAAGTVSFLSLYNPEWREDSIKCPMPWNEARALYGGEIKFCCWQPGSIGSVRTEALADIWDGQEAREVRRDLLDGKIPRLCSGAACPYVKGMTAPD